jgi:hypothetical protein
LFRSCRASTLMCRCSLCNSKRMIAAAEVRCYSSARKRVGPCASALSALLIRSVNSGSAEQRGPAASCTAMPQRHDSSSQATESPDKRSLALHGEITDRSLILLQPSSWILAGLTPFSYKHYPRRQQCSVATVFGKGEKE